MVNTRGKGHKIWSISEKLAVFEEIDNNIKTIIKFTDILHDE